MSRIAQRIQKILFGIALIFPIMVAVLTAFVQTFISWENLGWAGHSREYFGIGNLDYRLAAFAICVVVVIVLSLITKLIKWLSAKCSIAVKNRLLVTAVLIYGIAFLSRLFYFLLTDIKAQPFSDFKQIWGLANGDMSDLAYKSLFASWMNYARLVRSFVDTFGNNYLLFLLLNAAVSSLTAPLIYIIVGKRCFESVGNNFAVISALIYAFYPASAIFATNAAPDIYVVPAYIAGVMLLLICNELLDKQSIVSLLFAAVAGWLCGISAAFKSFAIVIIIAWSITEALRLLKGASVYRIILGALCVLSLLGTHIATKDLILVGTQQVYNVNLEYDTATTHYLSIGLNTEGEGQIHIGGLSRTFSNLVLQDGLSSDEASEKTMEILAEDWNKKPIKIIPLFIKKMIWAWQDDTIPVLYYLTYTLDTNSVIGKAADKGLTSLAQISYMIVMTLAAIGMIDTIKNHSNSDEFLFIALIVIGYFCVVLLSEAQSRYKYLIMPLICIFAGMGAAYAYRWVYGQMKKLLNVKELR